MIKVDLLMIKLGYETLDLTPYCRVSLPQTTNFSSIYLHNNCFKNKDHVKDTFNNFVASTIIELYTIGISKPVLA